MAYVKPQDITSPVAHWVLIDVVKDMGEGDFAIAIGRWDGKVVLGLRYNGDDSRPAGVPQARGHGYYLVLPDVFNMPVIAMLSSEKAALVLSLLRQNGPVEEAA